MLRRVTLQAGSRELTLLQTPGAGLGMPHADRSCSAPLVRAPVLVLKVPGMLTGKLIKRYKRFLADVCLDEEPTMQLATAIPAQQVVSSPNPAPVGSKKRRRRSDARNVLEATEREVVAAPVVEATCTGEITTMHCPNTGPMTGLLDWPRADVVCTLASAGAPGKRAARKYAHTLESIRSAPGGAWVGIHSALANKLVAALLADAAAPLVPLLGPYSHVAAEVKLGVQSRVDFLLTRPEAEPGSPGGLAGSKLFVEVKSVTLARETDGGRIALFPDTVSLRAQKHVKDLMAEVRKGHEAALVFAVQRGDCVAFSPSAEHDPTYADLLRQAADCGVRLIALSFDLQPVAASPHGSLDFWFLGATPVILP